jgi:type IV secretory pathway TrbD component
MAESRRINQIQRSLSRPLTILGAERKLFFFAMRLGAAAFNLLGSLLSGLLIFSLLYFVARSALRAYGRKTARAVRPNEVHSCVN